MAHLWIIPCAGYPGTGKTYLSELIGAAQHGPERGSRAPHYARFAMQNYKSDEVRAFFYLVIIPWLT